MNYPQSTVTAARAYFARIAADTLTSAAECGRPFADLAAFKASLQDYRAEILAGIHDHNIVPAFTRQRSA